jgi:hypothetical protein
MLVLTEVLNWSSAGNMILIQSWFVLCDAVRLCTSVGNNVGVESGVSMTVFVETPVLPLMLLFPSPL